MTAEDRAFDLADKILVEYLKPVADEWAFLTQMFGPDVATWWTLTGRWM